MLNEVQGRPDTGKVRNTVVFAEKIVVHGRTPLSVVPAPILGDIYVRAARMHGEDTLKEVIHSAPR